MPKSKPPKSEPGLNDPNTLRMSIDVAAEPPVLAAKIALRPGLRAAVTTRAYSKAAFGEMDLTTLVDELGHQIDAVHRGDLKRAETMLISQAHTLDAIFHELARRAGLNMGEYLDAAETYMRLALKAQSQCRSTLETLAEIKNPKPVAFVQQANIAHGPQQVNNGTAPTPAEPSRAGESEKPPNKLLESRDGERLDTGAAGAAGDADSQMATVGAVNRPQNDRR
jgi:hypothetical protein